MHQYKPRHYDWVDGKLKYMSIPVPLEPNFPTCVPLNDKPRDFFLLYHITFTGGTSMSRIADRAELPWDGMNTIYNPYAGQSKEDYVRDMLNNRVKYSLDSEDRVRPYDRMSWERVPNHNVTEIPNSTLIPDFTLKRRYASIEAPMDKIWEGVPVGIREVNTFFIIRNPLPMFMKFVMELHPKFVMDASVKEKSRAHMERVFQDHHNYALRSLSGHRRNNSLNLPHKGGNLAVIGSKVTEEHYIIAEQRLHQFDHQLILEDMHETTRFLCCEWGWPICSSHTPQVPRMDRIHETPLQWFGGDEVLYREFLEGSKWDFKLYDVAVQIALKQLKAMQLNSTVLEGFPRDSRQALLDELEQELKQQGGGKQ